jgi:hypothetical protein
VPIPVAAPFSRLLESFSPAETALLDWVAPHLDAAAVDEIAAADYGQDYPEHRRAIAGLLGSRRIPERMDWVPVEVLSLVRWSPPADERAHLMRLFCSLVLMRVATDQTVGGPVQALTPLVESALALGPAALPPVRGYVAWCRLAEPGAWRSQPAEVPFLTLALLLLAAAMERPDADPDADLVRAGLALGLVQDVAGALAAEDRPWTVNDPLPLLRFAETGANRRLWRTWTRRFLLEPPAPAGDPGTHLHLLAHAVIGDLPASTAELLELFGDGAG